MKKLTLSFLIFLMLFSSNMGMSETLDDLIYHKGLYYKKLSDDPFSVNDIPFSGKTTGKYQGAFKNGKQEGPWIYNTGEGQLLHKGNYKNGRREGLWVSNYDNGQLGSIGSYKDGKKDGLWKDSLITAYCQI